MRVILVNQRHFDCFYLSSRLRLCSRGCLLVYIKIGTGALQCMMNTICRPWLNATSLWHASWNPFHQSCGTYPWYAVKCYKWFIVYIIPDFGNLNEQREWARFIDRWIIQMASKNKNHGSSRNQTLAFCMAVSTESLLQTALEKYPVQSFCQDKSNCGCRVAYPIYYITVINFTYVHL